MGAMNQRSPIHFQWREVGGGGGAAEWAREREQGGTKLGES